MTYFQRRNRLIDIEANLWLPRASLVAQRVKHLPVVRETTVQSLGWEDPLEKEMATHSGILAQKIPCKNMFFEALTYFWSKLK